MEYLDLGLHSPDEVPGKLIHLNGVDYQFGKLYGEGGHGYIFPLKNTISGLFPYAAKLSRFRKGSEYFERQKQHLQSLFKTFSLADVTGTIESGTTLKGVTRSEIYECCGGGLFQIMDFYGQGEFGSYRKRASMSKYLRILRDEPNNSYVLFELARCYSDLSDHDKAIKACEKALRIEPNDADGYHFAAKIYARAGWYLEAIFVLQRNIDRYPGNAYTIHLQSFIAYQEKRMDIIEKNIHLLEQEFGDDVRSATVINYYKKNYLYRPLSLSIETIAKDPERLINDMIRKYEEGYYAEAMDQLSQVLKVLPDLPHLDPFPKAMTCVILLVLCSFPMEDYGTGIHYIVFLAGNIDEPADMPRIPVSIRDRQIKDTGDVSRLIKIIKFLLEVCTAEQRKPLQKALRLYQGLSK